MASSDVVCDLQVKDVYDFAHDIAEEFDKIVHCIDIELATPLINKVINVLELLEESVRKIDQLEKENSEIKAKYVQLYREKTANEEDKFNLKQAFEELEESWSQESRTLKSFISKLKAENQLLQHDLAEKKEIPHEIGDSYKTVIEDQEKFISRLKSHLKQKDIQLEKDRTTIEVLNSKVENLLELNKSLHLQYQEAKLLMNVSKLEKSECESKLDLQEQKLHQLESRFDAFRKSVIEKNEYGSKSEHVSHDENYYLSEESLKCLLEEQHDLKQKVSKLQMELVVVKSQTEEYKRKLLKVSDAKNPMISSPGNGRIQQIFRLFLGVVDINPQICWFRGI